MKEKYGRLQKRVEHRGEWDQWTHKPAYRKADNQKEEYLCMIANHSVFTIVLLIKLYT